MMLIIERATEEDYPDLCAIDQACGHGRFDYIAGMIRARQMYVARDGWDRLGFITYKPDFFGHPFIDLLVVHPDARRQGVAAALVAHLERLLPDQKLFTSTNESNLPAQALFAKLGFVQSGRIENLDEADPEIIYYKWLV